MLHSKAASRKSPAKEKRVPPASLTEDVPIDPKRRLPIELRVLIAPPSSDALTASVGSRRYENVRRYEWSSTELVHRRVELRRPHWLLDGATSPLLHDITQRLPYSMLPYSMLLVTHCTISVSAAEEEEKELIISSDSFTEQGAFDEAVSALPLSCSIRVDGQVAGFDRGEPLLGQVTISLSLQLHSSDHIPPDSYMGLAAVRSISVLEAADRATSTFWEVDHSADRRRWSEEAAVNTPLVATRLADIVEDTVRLSTHFALLPSVVVPMCARLMRVSMRVDNVPVGLSQGLIQDDAIALFELVSPLDTSVDIQELLNCHQQRVTAASSLVDVKASDWGEVAALSSFMAIAPIARLSSLFLVCSPAVRTGRPLTVEVSFTSSALLQLRGFHLPTPTLTFQLHSRAFGVQASFAMISGEARAQLSISSTKGGELEQLQCSTQVKLHGTGELRVAGECMDLMRMSDVMAAQADNQPPSAPLSSLTTVAWLTERVIARYLPSLRPSVPPADLRPTYHPFNDIYSSYHFPSHRMAAPVLHNLTMQLDDSTAAVESSSTARCVLVDGVGPGRGAGTTHMHLSFSPLLHADCNLSFPQLLSLGGLHEMAAILPTALIATVRFKSATSHLVVRASDGVADFTLGIANCGVSRLDELLWFIRLAARGIAPATSPQSVAHSSPSLSGQPATASSGVPGPTPSSEEMLLSSAVTRWIKLQCREKINEAVFPHLTTVCAQEYLRPLWQYVYCDTEGGVTADQSQVKAFDSGHMGVCRHQHYHLSIPTGYRPMNSLVALQPHLPHGFHEVPVSEQLFSADPVLTSSDSSSSSSPSSQSSSAPTLSRLNAVERGLSTHWLARLSVDAMDVFHSCMDYLDCNSLFFGLLPATHSLPPAVSAAITSASYWRHSLIIRYGRYSDIGRWSAEVLERWRREGPQLQREDINVRFKKSTEQQQRLLQLVDQQEKQLARYGVFHAAALHIQIRLNRFLICVMQQPVDLVVPQRAVSAVASASPASLTSAHKPAHLHMPEAAFPLLLSAPPFCPLPAGTKKFKLLWDGEKAHFANNGVSGRALDNLPTGESTGDFLGLLATRAEWHRSSVWSLYTGPTYIYSNLSGARPGSAVIIAPSTLLVPADQWDRPFEGRVDESRLIQLLYPSDANTLPIVRRTPGRGNNKMTVYSPTLVVCFKRLGIDRLISRIRRQWLRAAQLIQADGRRQVEDGEGVQEKQEKDSMQTEEAEDEQDKESEDENGGSDDESSDDVAEAVAVQEEAGGMHLVRPLMKRLLNDMESAMYAST